jgi:hypothetical protein
MKCGRTNTIAPTPITRHPEKYIRSKNCSIDGGYNGTRNLRFNNSITTRWHVLHCLIFFFFLSLNNIPKC